MYTSEADFSHVIKSSQPPIIEIPHPSNLTRSRILRTNEPGTQLTTDDHLYESIVVPSPVVQRKEILMGRARRTLTDDGSADVVHHIGIVSPPLSYSIVKRPSPQTKTTSTTDQFEPPHVSTVAPPDFVDRTAVYIRHERAHRDIIQPSSDDLVDGPLSTSHQVLFKDDDYEPSLRRPVQVNSDF
jgi:hypothetical protein